MSQSYDNETDCITHVLKILDSDGLSKFAKRRVLMYCLERINEEMHSGQFANQAGFAGQGVIGMGSLKR